MRRLLVILAALGMIFAVRTLRMDGALTGPDPLTLAAIGFVVLAAFTVGELGRYLKLPKITGYIVSGVLLGPQALDVLSKQVVGEMQTFNTLALGLIATTAGLELDLSAIRKVLRTLLTTVAAKVPLLVVIVGGAFFAAESMFGVLGIGSSGEIMALGLVFAVLGIGTSPAIALAIVNETRAKGRLSDLVLAIAVVKDLVVVVALAIAIAVARVFVAPDAPFGADVLVHVAEELGASIAVGAVVGVVLIAYMRFVKVEMLLAVLVAILLTAELSQRLHLELLLVFIAAGFVVRNFSKYEHELLHSLERIALPVFVVFFTTAGADVDLQGTLTLLPIAIVIAVARGLAFFLSAKLGATVGREAPPVAKNAWMAYLPQAGVTLGLVFLAADKLPELADPLRQTGMAMVALHLLIGPILLGVALRRAGEIPAEAGDAPEPEAAHGHEAEAAERPRVAPPAKASALLAGPPTAQALAERIRAPALLAPLEHLRQTFEAQRAHFLEVVTKPRAEDATAYAQGIFAPAEDGESTVMAIHRRLPKQRPELVADWVPAVQRLEQTIRAEVHRLDNVVAVPMDDDLVQPRSDDGLGTSVRKLVTRTARQLGLRRGKNRYVPLRLIGRLATEKRLAEAAVALAGAWPRTYAAMLDEVRAVVGEEKTKEEGRAEVERVASLFLAYVDRELSAAAAEILETLLELAAEAGGPVRPLSSLRFSRVEPAARAARQRVEREAQAWHRVADAAFDTARAQTAVLAFGETLQEVLHKRVRGPLETAREQLLPVIEQVQQRLQAAGEQLAEDPLEAPQAERAAGLARSAYPKADRTRVRRARGRFRRSAQAHLLVSELSRVIDGIPADLTVLAPGTVLDVDDRVEAVTTVPLDFGRRAEAVFLERLAPRLDEVLGPVSDLVAGSDLRLDEVVQVATYGIEAAEQAHPEPGEERAKLLRAAVGRACEDGETLRLGFVEALEAAEQALEAEGARATEELAAMLGADAGAGRRVRSQVRATRRAIRARVEAFGAQVAAWLTSAAQRFGDGHAHGGERQVATALSPAELRRRIDGETQPFPGLELPPLHDKLFSPQPVEDLRLAVAHRDVLDVVSRHVGTRGQGSARVLIVGEHGSGRTSLLNALELRHQRVRVVRLDAFFHLRAEGLISALAAELACRDHERAVLEALTDRPTVVLIDDLERHVTADEAGAREIERLCNIVVASRARTSWVVTTTPVAQAALRVLGPFEEVFAETVPLPELSASSLREVVEARARLGGLVVDLPRPGPLARLRRGSDADEMAYYGRLRAVTSGNLRAGLQVFLRSLRPGESGRYAAVLPEPPTLPGLASFSAQALAMLALMIRFGPHDVPELAHALRLPEGAARRCAMHLLDAGLLYHPGSSPQDMLYVPPECEKVVTLALTRLGLLAEERS